MTAHQNYANSGKTTLIKALLQEIPTGQRIITFEDAEEIPASAIIESSLRRKPPRIALAEKQKGFTLIELLISLGLVVGFVGLMIGLYQLVTSSGKQFSASSQILAVQASYHSAYDGQNTYGVGDITAAKYFPSDLKNNNGVIKNKWGGIISVTGADDRFIINWPNVPDDSCSKIAILKSPDIKKVTINGNDAGSPVLTATANNLCTAGTNTVSYTSE